MKSPMERQLRLESERAIEFGRLSRRENEAKEIAERAFTAGDSATHIPATRLYLELFAQREAMNRLPSIYNDFT